MVFEEWAREEVPWQGVLEGNAVIVWDEAQKGKAAPTAPEPALGTLYPFVAEILRHQTPRLSYFRCKEMGVEAWKEAARARIREALCYDPPPCELNLEVVKSEERSTYVRHHVTFWTTPYTRVPAYLFIPATGRSPHPAVLALHDHGGFFYYGKEKLSASPGEHPALTEFRKRYYDGLSVADELARRGYVVLVIDAFYWGERRLQLTAPGNELERQLQGLDPRQPEYVHTVNRFLGQRTRVLNTLLTFSGTSWLGILLHDERRSLDLLAGLPEVDPNRLGVVGLSIGGYRATYLIGTDPRVKAACIAGWMTKLAAGCVPKAHPGHLDIPYAQNLHAYLDHPDVASLAAPECALFVLQCAADPLFTWEGMMEAVELLRDVYQDLGRPERFRAQFFDVPHCFDRTMQQEAYAWLDRWLK